MAKKYSLLHPEDIYTRATYGWTPDFGFHATRLVEDNPTQKVRSRHLADILSTLAEWGFFEAHDRTLALQQLSFLMPEEMEDREIARCARVIVDLRRAAD